MQKLKPQVVASYQATQSEVNLSALHSEMSDVVFPCIEKGEMNFYRAKQFLKGKLGILEPVVGQSEAVTRDEIDLVLVPGIGFDRRGHRLGYGAGYYDRWLKGQAVSKVGVAFMEQIYNEGFKAETHDVAMDWVVTDQFILNPLAAMPKRA